jgi:hypothetical protein
MANIVITSSTNVIKCDNGVYAGLTGPLGVIQKKVAFRKDDIFRISLEPTELYVEVQFKSRGNSYFLLTFNGVVGTLQVDLVDSITPTSNSDLYDKLVAILG